MPTDFETPRGGRIAFEKAAICMGKLNRSEAIREDILYDRAVKNLSRNNKRNKPKDNKED